MRTAREWSADAAVMVLGLLLGLIFIQGDIEESKHRFSTGHIVYDLTTGLVAAAALLLLSRRYPIGLAIVLIPIGVSSATALGTALLSLFPLAVQRPWRPVVAVAGAMCATVSAAFALGRDDRQQTLPGIVFVLLFGTILVVFGMLIRSRRMLVDSLRERARQAEEGQRMRIEEARHLERERLAREMHDVLAHRISLLAVHAGALEYALENAATDRAKAAAGIIRQSAYEAMEELREVIGMLRPPEAARPQPTLGDLPRLLEEVREAGARIELDDRVGEPAAVPERIGRHAYRIIQEGLTNARKHAPDARVRIALGGRAGDELTVEVRNPVAVGAPARLPGSGAGLIGLTERVALVGGELEHGVVDGDFRLLARLPWSG
jgi:signal transduction histidine kinase